MKTVLIKLTFIQGLQSVVLDELQQHPELHIVEKQKDCVYVHSGADAGILRGLKSILNIFAVTQGTNLNPGYISNHKSILGDLIELSVSSAQQSGDKFRTYKLSCAGATSPEVIEIQKYIADTYRLVFADEADMEMYIGKSDDVWEVGVRLTSRPLSVREYKVAHIKGGLNPTIAYAMNTFCHLESAHSYLNIFSGSGTLVTEAGRINPHLVYVGFDNNGKSIALSVQNIKKAGFIKSVQLKNANIFDKPNVGKFDVIASDLPFGMQISKVEDLNSLYKCFVEYVEGALNPEGVLVVYTTEHTLLENILKNSKLKIVNELQLKVSTVVNAYIHPKIFVCTL